MSPLLCRLDRLQQKLLLIVCIWYFSVGQRTIRQHCPSCVTTRCCHERPGNLEAVEYSVHQTFPSCQSGLARETNRTEWLPTP